jgi:hydroxyacylglutathione hydrolase
MFVRRFSADGVSDRSYMIVDPAGGRAAVVDAQRDAWTYLDEAEKIGVKITHTFDTHVHNDFISGSRALQELTGATVVQPAGAEMEYPVREVRDGDRVEVGGFVVRALHTPGHTFHHTSYAVEEDGNVAGLFTGGSLLVQTVGRTDLVSPGATEELARAQRASLRRLAEFPDDTEVFPTHGAGSFCSAGDAPDRETTSIGREKRENAAVHIALFEDEDAFVRHALHGLPAYPAYYTHMAPANRRGAPPLSSLPVLNGVEPRAAHEMQSRGVALVDARKPLEFAAAYPRGARNVPLGDSFAGYIGWVLPFDAELVLVLPSEDDWRRAQGQLIRIGFDRAQGYVHGGFPAWQRDGLPVDRLTTIDVVELQRLHEAKSAEIVDVRQDAEWRAGHVPGALHIPIGMMPARLGDVGAESERRVVTMCASGMRATIAASLLRRVGYDPFVVVPGGFDDWAEHGWPVETGR